MWEERVSDCWGLGNPPRSWRWICFLMISCLFEEVVMAVIGVEVVMAVMAEVGVATAIVIAVTTTLGAGRTAWTDPSVLKRQEFGHLWH